MTRKEIPFHLIPSLMKCSVKFYSYDQINEEEVVFQPTFYPKVNKSLPQHVDKAPNYRKEHDHPVPALLPDEHEKLVGDCLKEISERGLWSEFAAAMREEHTSEEEESSYVPNFILVDSPEETDLPILTDDIIARTLKEEVEILKELETFEEKQPDIVENMESGSRNSRNKPDQVDLPVIDELENIVLVFSNDYPHLGRQGLYDELVVRRQLPMTKNYIRNVLDRHNLGNYEQRMEKKKRLERGLDESQKI